MMAVTQNSSTIPQPKNMSQMTLAMQVNGCRGFVQGDVFVLNAHCSAYVSRGMGSKQKLQQQAKSKPAFAVVKWQ